MTKYLMITAVVFLCSLLVYTDSQANLPNADEVRDNISIILENHDLNGLNTSVIPAIEEATNIFKKKCQKNGGDGAYERANRAREDMTQCLKSLVNITQLQEEMEKYKPTGDLDIVFKNYCRKSPILKECVSNFTAAIEPCLDEKEKENKRIIQNITDSLLNFICFKEGDRIALFISAGGPECLQSKQQLIQDCVNATFGSYAPTTDPKTGSLPELESLPSLIIGSKECTDITIIQSCIVKELEKCTDPTPANIVDSIFNFILRVTPCHNILPMMAVAFSDSPSSATQAISFLSMTIVPLLFTLRFI